jgi:hypothetical protein
MLGVPKPDPGQTPVSGSLPHQRQLDCNDHTAEIEFDLRAGIDPKLGDGGEEFFDGNLHFALCPMHAGAGVDPETDMARIAIKNDRFRIGECLRSR